MSYSKSVYFGITKKIFFKAEKHLKNIALYLWRINRPDSHSVWELSPHYTVTHAYTTYTYTYTTSHWFQLKFCFFFATDQLDLDKTRIRILIWSGYWDLITKNYLFLIKIWNIKFLGLYEGCPSYRKSPQPSKRTSSTLKQYISSLFSYLLT